MTAGRIKLRGVGGGAGVLEAPSIPLPHACPTEINFELPLQCWGLVGIIVNHRYRFGALAELFFKLPLVEMTAGSTQHPITALLPHGN